MNDHAVARALEALGRLHTEFGTLFPGDTTVGDLYRLRSGAFGLPDGSNHGWTTGFYTGMLWLALELTGEDTWHEAARAQVPSFVQRFRDEIDIDLHDNGFLYSLSCVPAWRSGKDTMARDAAVGAAGRMLRRVHETPGVIQSWGALDNPEERGRAIIDSLMNMPLLYWASEVSGDKRYREAALRHVSLLRDHIIRPDGSTFHTFHWDVHTGEPLGASTHQGYADDSVWARGQAWGIYGFVLSYQFTTDSSYLDASKRCADYFLAHLPESGIPLWDFSLTPEQDSQRDSSAAAIAVCGLKVLAREAGEAGYSHAADNILDSLVRECASSPPATDLLREGVYGKPMNVGVNEGCLWGDYFYIEALLRRQSPEWISYWEPYSHLGIYTGPALGAQS